MTNLIREATPLVGMILVAIILITCIANDIDHGIIYTGLTILSGLGGYSVGKVVAQKAQPKK